VIGHYDEQRSEPAPEVWAAPGTEHKGDHIMFVRHLSARTIVAAAAAPAAAMLLAGAPGADAQAAGVPGRVVVATDTGTQEFVNPDVGRCYSVPFDISAPLTHVLNETDHPITVFTLPDCEIANGFVEPQSGSYTPVSTSFILEG